MSNYSLTTVKWSQVITNITEINNSTNFNYKLSQNYPNPFNPETVINYDLRVTSNMKLKVFDVLGNEVVELANEKHNAGSYSVKFDGSGFASGIYFYSLITNGVIIDTKRMILLK
ncbi:MAG: T9SS type A sorting domain-containing protein [Ignavibacteria bacterium]|nr:T9SS type A sorting domain-containing protein [Ignavibacteria bacterium]